jgi:hypothetical protein
MSSVHQKHLELKLNPSKLFIIDTVVAVFCPPTECQSTALHAVRKNAAHKESSQEKSHVLEQGLMAGPNCQAGQGKDGAAQTLGQAWLL